MSVWYCIPSARPVEDIMPAITQWRFMGYNVALFRDEGADDFPGVLNIHGKYPGYANAVNLLARLVLQDDPKAEWIVTGGDDITPDPHNGSDNIGWECTVYFNGTLGVMQPSGDRFMEDSSGRCAAERVCCSPWMGREWCLKGYGGKGPLWHEYFHFFVDEDLHHVAKRDGLLWHRRDLTQYHNHWSRAGNKRPEFLGRAQKEWAQAKQIFIERQKYGFPGSHIA